MGVDVIEDPFPAKALDGSGLKRGKKPIFEPSVAVAGITSDPLPYLLADACGRKQLAKQASINLRFRCNDMKAET